MRAVWSHMSEAHVIHSRGSREYKEEEEEGFRNHHQPFYRAAGEQEDQPSSPPHLTYKLQVTAHLVAWLLRPARLSAPVSSKLLTNWIRSHQTRKQSCSKHFLNNTCKLLNAETPMSKN